MKRSVLPTLVFLLSFLVTTSAAYAAAPNDGLQIPITGSGSALTFVGTFDVQKFVVTDTGIAAVGTLTGTATNTAGIVTGIVKNIKLPVLIGATSCDILHLELGPLNLDLLGLQVDLSRIILDIDAQAGAGNLLGNLLCAVTGLLDNPTGLVKLLNDILSILG